MSSSIYENLAVTRNRLLNEINVLSFEVLNNKHDHDQWSVAQVCHHLFLIEMAITNAIHFGLKQNNSIKAYPKPIHLATDRTIKTKAPDIVIPGEGPFELKQLIEMLNGSRKILLDVLSKIEDKSALTEKSAKHPFFGDLPLNQWIELVYLHEQRHIEQIKELIE